MKDRILIKKDLIPYGFNIALGKEKFNMKFDYNKQSDLFTVSLYRDGVLLCDSEPIIYGVSLFQDVYQSGRFPVLDIIPLDESGSEQEVTWENFGNTVFLTINSGG